MKSVKGYIINNFDIFIFAGLIFIKIISLDFELHVIRQMSLGLLLGCIGSTLILASLVNIFNFNTRIKFYVLFDLAISILLLTDIIYNRYFYDVTSIALIKQAKLVGEVTSSVFALFHFSDLLYFLDIIILVPLLKYLNNIFVANRKRNILKGLSQVVAFVIIGCFFSFLSVKALDKRQPGILKTLYDKKYVVANIGDINFHIYDLYRYISNNILEKQNISKLEKNKIFSWFENKNKVSKNSYTNSMNGKNLIVVQLESFQGFLLNQRISGQEITPNLNKLSKESLVFNNYHYQTSWGGTSDAEFLSNTSMLPAPDGSVYYLYSGNTFDSMISELKGEGYFTSVMHANRPGFWNRSSMYKSLGFDRYESILDFKKDDIQGLGLSDKSFYRQGVEKMSLYKKPFYTFLISLSSHFPYKDSRDKIKNIIDVGEFEGSRMGDYLKSIKYSDEAIGEFINELKAAKLWENSVVVFYGDHGAIQYDKRSQLARLLYQREELTDEEWYKEQRVIAMIHFPKGEIKGMSSKVSCQMDLPPTLGNLFGFKMNYALGKDLLGSKDGFYLSNNGVWAYNNIVYLKNPDEVVDIKSGKVLNKKSYIKIFQMAKDYKYYSEAILRNNLIKVFNTNLHMKN